MPNLLTPDRVVTSAPRCDQPVAGSGLMSYHCSLPQGHIAASPNITDPEPCWAVESDRSARLWDAWKRRQMKAEAAVAPVDDRIVCPACRERSMRVEDGTGSCENEDCGVTAEMQPDLPTLDPADAEIQQAAQAFVENPDLHDLADVAEEFGVDLDEPEHPQPLTHVLREEAEHNLTDPDCQMRPAEPALHSNPDARCWACRPAPEGFERMPQLGHSTISIDAEALRTREGDQRLPDGDESLADDQSLLIADIEERRRLGISRYGQGHRPFNGRNTLRDAYEERLDELVYFRSIVRQSDATREDLVEVVTEALAKAGLGIHGDYEKSGEALAAEVAVDRIMGYVSAKIIEANPYPQEATDVRDH